MRQCVADSDNDLIRRISSKIPTAEIQLSTGTAVAVTMFGVSAANAEAGDALIKKCKRVGDGKEKFASH